MSEPLDHLLSVDLGERSLFDVFDDEGKTKFLTGAKKPVKKVRFADTCFQHKGDVSLGTPNGANEKDACKSNEKEIKGILKMITTSDLNQSREIKGWSKPGPSVPLTVSIVSGTDDICSKTTDAPDKNFEDPKNSKGIDALAAMERANEQSDDATCVSGDYKNQETDEHEMESESYLDSPSCEDDADLQSGFVEDSRSFMLKTENDDDRIDVSESGTSQINTYKLDDKICDEMRSSENVNKNIGHHPDSNKYLLVDEIRKISTELFVETASHLKGNENNIPGGIQNGEIFPDKSFINTDIVNDIVSNHAGQERLYFPGTVNSESSNNTKTEGKLDSGGSTQSIESSEKLGSKAKRPSSPHTWKLKRMLEEIAPEKPTAKDLRTIAFNAWCAIKAEENKSFTRKQRNAEKQTEATIMKEKSLKEASAIKAFTCWKEQKEKIIKLRKEADMKVAETKLSKAEKEKKMKKEDANLVFRAWKKKKDEEIKDQLRKQKLQMQKEHQYKGQSEEMKKLDAAAAFNAWKSQKAVELQRKEKECLLKKEVEESLKMREKSERDKEAIKAYELWLECKEQYEDSFEWRNHLDIKPPWSPPGRIT